MKEVTKVLFCSANPNETSRLRLDQEYREIDNSLRASNFRDKFELNSSWATTTQDLLQKVVNIEPNIVHFSGHGTDSGIILENSIGNRVIVSGEGLSALFEVFLGKVQCVILNSCYSEKQAKLINNFVPYVIGMSQSLQDSTAISFSSGFYKAIGAGKDIPVSFKLGIASVKLEGLPSSDIPLIISNSKLQVGYESFHVIEQQKRTLSNSDPDKTLIAVDVDDFTVISSRFGRRVGDEIKKIISETISAYLGEIEISFIHNWIVPYSDEYYILIDLNITSAQIVADKIRERISNYDWKSISPELFVTVCCGVASYTIGDTPEDLLIKALLGVKDAKARGKNSTAKGPKYLPNNTNRLTKADKRKVTYFVSGSYETYVKDVLTYGGEEYENATATSMNRFITKQFEEIEKYLSKYS